MRVNASRWILIGLICVALCAGTIALAKGKPGGGGNGGCEPDPFVVCPMVYDPVDCDQGRFGNQCEADRACATNCEPVGPGPIPIEL